MAKLNEFIEFTYKRNMKALKKRYPELAKKTEQLKDNTGFSVNPNKDGKTFNLYLKELKKFYYDTSNQLYDIKVNMDGLKLKNTKAALFLGFGLGYELIYYLQSLANEQRTGIIVVIEEKLEIFTMALYTTDIVSIINNKKIFLIVGKTRKIYLLNLIKYFPILEI